MDPISEIALPTTETEPKALPTEVPPVQVQILIVLVCLLVLVTLTIAYWAAEVIFPIILAVLLNLLLQPLMRAMGKAHIPRVISAAVLIAGGIGIFVGVGAAVSGPARHWAERLPAELPKLQQRLSYLRHPLDVFDNALGQLDGVTAQHEVAVLPDGGVSSMIFHGTQFLAGSLVETVLILFFLLLSGDLFLRRAVETLPGFKEKRRAVDLARQIESNISAYLLTITAMNTTVGLATGLAAWACGLEYPVLWGVMAFLLNFLPILGACIGIGVLALAGLLQFDTMWQAFFPAGIYLAIHFLEGETITPMLLARRFTLNPVLVIISLIFWFWMWGVAGAIIAVPMLATTKLVCDGIERLNAFGRLLEGGGPARS